MVHSSGRDALPGQTDETDSRSGVARWLYRLIALISAAFILTIFIMIAVTMSDPTVPVNRDMSKWIDRYAAKILIAEVTAIGLLVVCAFTIDRRESWKRYHREYAEWERRMQQLTAEKEVNPQTDPHAGSEIAPGDAE